MLSTGRRRAAFLTVGLVLAGCTAGCAGGGHGDKAAKQVTAVPAGTADPGTATPASSDQPGAAAGAPRAPVSPGSNAATPGDAGGVPATPGVNGTTPDSLGVQAVHPAPAGGTPAAPGDTAGGSGASTAGQANTPSPAASDGSQSVSPSDRATPEQCDALRQLQSFVNDSRISQLLVIGGC